MTRLFLDHPLRKDSEVILTGEKARYLQKVLRCSAGDSFVITDPSSSSFNAEIISTSGREVTLMIRDMITIQTESPVNIVLVQGMLKGDKMDHIIQKATELGVSTIVPAITERSIARETRKTSRWRKIAEEASRQCGRQKVPGISEPREFIDILNDPDLASHGRIMFWEEGGICCSAALCNLKDRKDIVLFTGPEGGFSKTEASSAENSGFVLTSLGSRILRAETAAITVVALAQFVLGDIDNSYPVRV